MHLNIQQLTSHKDFTGTFWCYFLLSINKHLDPVTFMVGWLKFMMPNSGELLNIIPTPLYRKSGDMCVTISGYEYRHRSRIGTSSLNISGMNDHELKLKASTIHLQSCEADVIALFCP